MTEFVFYTTREGDRWDLIAWDQYGDAFAFPALMRANPLVAPEPVLAGGLVLKVPVVAAVVENPVFAPWRS